MGRVCYHPCETACNRGAARRGGRDQLRRALPRRRGDRAGLAGRGRRRRPPASACSSSAPGPSGLSAAYHLARLGHEVTICDAGPMAGGMMRFGIPRYRLPRDVLDAEVAADPRPRRHARAGHEGHEHPRGDAGGRLRRRLPRRRRPARQARLHPGRLGGADPRRRLAAAQHGGRGAAAARPPGRRLRRRQHRDGRRPDREAARRRGGDRRLPPHARPDARARLRGRGGRGGGRADEVALHDQAGRRRASSWSSGWSSTRPASRSRPASSRSSRPTRSCSRSARRPTCRCSTACPGLEVEDGVVEVGPNMMTGHPGIFAGGDMVPAERTVTVARRPRQEGGPPHRRLAARRRATSRPPKHDARRPSTRSTPGTTRTRRAPCSRSSSSPAAQSTFDEVVGGLDESNALFEARRCLSCGNCFSCDNCYGVCPDNAVIKLGEPGRARTRSTSTTARAAASASPSARAARSRWCPSRSSVTRPPGCAPCAFAVVLRRPIRGSLTMRWSAGGRILRATKEVGHEDRETHERERDRGRA